METCMDQSGISVFHGVGAEMGEAMEEATEGRTSRTRVLAIEGTMLGIGTTIATDTGTQERRAKGKDVTGVQVAQVTKSMSLRRHIQKKRSMTTIEVTRTKMEAKTAIRKKKRLRTQRARTRANKCQSMHTREKSRWHVPG